eukprot:TRINITY_DN1673_c0_g1_i10.p1 TRINITY_DN1673_c0_g1~~TRINITY_DN1673_c0_g1_i10.p1  ORF type:complete len:403 (-),score=64.79 TRINITY_DN1673_c0_g1_i10:473-1681(-)
MTLIEEYHVNDKNVRRYKQINENGFSYLQPVKNSSNFGLATIWNTLRSIFLPEGYPDSVSSDYIYYQGWDTVQAFASSISGSIATSAVLQGVGVGDETATPLAASITWLLRDGCGMVGRILFAAKFGTQLDYDCKKWRLFADVLNDVAMFIEILTPSFSKDLTLGVLCCASVSRSLVGVAGGATKAAVAQHQAKAGNMADLAAKDGSQETMVNLLALLVNLTLLPWLAQYKDFVMPLFMLMTCLHIFANYKAVTSLQFSNLNMARLTAILEAYLATGSILSITEGNKRESLAFSLRRPKIRLGASVHHSRDIAGMNEILGLDPFYVQFNKNDIIYIILNSKATTRDILAVYIDAWMSRNVKEKGKKIDGKQMVEKLSKSGWNVDQRAIQTEGFTFTPHPHAD